MGCMVWLYGTQFPSFPYSGIRRRVLGPCTCRDCVDSPQGLGVCSINVQFSVILQKISDGDGAASPSLTGTFCKGRRAINGTLVKRVLGTVLSILLCSVEGQMRGEEVTFQGARHRSAWRTVRHWGRFSPRTSVSPATQPFN
jgi:hypothetical protein